MTDEHVVEDFAALVNETANDGWMKANGFVVTKANKDVVEGEMTVLPAHLQAYGIVHGGVHAAIVETLASIGAAMTTMVAGKGVAGLDNHTSFLKAVRGGVLRGRATPLTRGRRSHLWNVDVMDASGAVVSTGRVRLIVLDADHVVGGEKIVLPGP